MKIAIICSVRGGTPENLYQYVEALEAQGHQVHFPPRDHHQDDPTGLGICEDMRSAIGWADEVHISYNKDSQGSHFDLGMAFMVRKRWKLINDPDDPPGKSYLKVIKSTCPCDLDL